MLPVWSSEYFLSFEFKKNKNAVVALPLAKKLSHYYASSNSVLATTGCCDIWAIRGGGGYAHMD